MIYFLINITMLILFIIFFKFLPVSKKIEYSFINNNYYKIVFVLFVVCMITSTYKLVEIPNGIHVDEAGMFFDAQLLMKFGYDRYLNFLPVYLINYGGGQSAMCAYIVVLLMKLFGNKIILMRLPNVIFRLISFISAIYLVRFEKNKLTRVVFLLLLTIVPYFIMQSRIGLDCNLLVSFMTISISFLVNAIYKKNKILFFLSGMFFGLSLYTYALSYIIILLFLIIIFLYLLYIKKICIKDVIVFVVPLFLLSIPLILFVLVNIGLLNEIHSIITVPKIPCFRGNEISLFNFFDSLIVMMTIVFQRSDGLTYNSILYFGTLYFISVPFVFFGIKVCYSKVKKNIKDKDVSIDLLIFVWFLSVIICMLIIKYPNVNKANAMFVPLLYFVAIGIISFEKIKRGIVKYIIILYGINFIAFSHYYYFVYSKDYYTQPFFVSYYLDSLEYVKKLDKKVIYIDPSVASQAYIYPYIENQIEYFNSNIFSTNKQIYVFSIPNQLDGNSLFFTKKINDNKHYKKIGDVYVVFNE